MWLLVVLLAAQPAQAETTPQPSVLMTRYRDADEVTLFGQGTPDGRMFDYTVPKTAFGRLPAWEVEKDPPPLAIARALEIAKKATRTEHPELMEFMPSTISIHQVGSHDRKTRWFYVINMYPMTNGEPSIDSQVTVVVLMDGTVVKPKERSKVAP
jgi:hypothetical protein